MEGICNGGEIKSTQPLLENSSPNAHSTFFFPLFLSCFCFYRLPDFQDPSDRDKIRLWLIDRMASESDVGQFRYLISSLFGRACRLKASSAGQADQARLKSEVTSVLDAVYEKLQVRERGRQ